MTAVSVSVLRARGGGPAQAVVTIRALHSVKHPIHCVALGFTARLLMRDA